MKKLLSILLVAILAISLTGAALADDKPIEILFWTTRASGAQATVVNHEVDTFNETIGKEKGIHITHEAQAGYPEIWAAFSTAAGSVAPDVVALGNTYIPYALDEDMLADVTGMEGADALRANLMDWVLDIAGNKDGELHSFPYIRSTPVLYYNKDIADELGITIPEQITIEQLEEFGSKAAQYDANGVATRYGFELLQDFGYYNAAWIYQLGSQFLAPEGGSPALEDGTMLRVLSDWRKWIDEGWCRPFDGQKAAGALSEFTAGRLASYINSCSAMAGIVKAAAEANITLGVAMFPTYDVNNHVAEIGGANVAIVKKDDATVAAAWEFVKYLMSDEAQYFNAINTGYCPCTKTVAENAEMQKFWEENPTFKVPFNQLLTAGRGQELPALARAQDFIKACEVVAGKVIQSKESTPEQGVEELKLEESYIDWAE